MKVLSITISLIAIASAAFAEADELHKIFVQKKLSRSINLVENGNEHWNKNAQKTLKEQTERKPNLNIAKNVIMFLGDGMSIPTLAAARIYKWQENSRMGEEGFLSFEKFPVVGLSRTYCLDTQVADSACSATAYLGGVKTNIGTIGVNGHIKRGNCKSSLDKANHVDSIAVWAQETGKSTGIVTTTRVTHASPAGTFAHTADRDWESDADILDASQNPKQCSDIAKQLVLESPGKNFNVILGGGIRNFIPKDLNNATLGKGKRRDGLNLIEEWHKDKLSKAASHEFVLDRKGLLSLENIPDYLLGLFSSSHLDYHLKAGANKPTLEEMTEAAIKVLQKNEEGYFLFVEGGLIDTAHHESKAHISFDETIEFEKAIQKAVSMTNESDTLIVVTADHAHTMSFSGYAPRTESIFGFGGMASDGKPYSIVSYANGRGFRVKNGARPDLSMEDTENVNYVFPSAAPLLSETHGGDDVGVFARGPFSHIFTGAYEQNYIPHAMAYASCVGKGLTACDK